MRQVLVPLEIKPPRPMWPPAREIVTVGGPTMGTTWSVKLAVPAGWFDSRVERGIVAELDRVIDQMSTWKTDSSISRFNVSAPGTWHDLEPEFFTVVEAAVHWAGVSDGAYDPTIGPAVDLWGFGPAAGTGVIPDAAAIAEARRELGWSRLMLDGEQRRLLQPGGIRLDLSSIAKGFGVDQVARYLLGAGFANFLVEVGGELHGEGLKPDGTPWFVELESPPSESADAVSPPETVIALHGLSVATSGDYRRAVVANGRSYSHTIDPRTGAPLDHALASVTVVAGDCMTADALATVLMVLGPGPAEALAERESIAARFVMHEGAAGLRTSMSPAMSAMLT
jgi:thiamine biosynthesis lipoprotein